MTGDDGVEAVAPRRALDRTRDEPDEIEAPCANGSIAACSAPGRWLVTNENEIRDDSHGTSTRVYGAIDTKRVNAGPSPTSSTTTVSP
jgi:hypothetical protein